MFSYRFKDFEGSGESGWNDAGIARAELGGIAVAVGNAQSSFDDAEELVLAGSEGDVPGAGLASPDPGREIVAGAQEVLPGGSLRIAPDEAIRTGAVMAGRGVLA